MGVIFFELDLELKKRPHALRSSLQPSQVLEEPRLSDVKQVAASHSLLSNPTDPFRPYPPT